VTDQKFSL